MCLCTPSGAIFFDNDLKRAEFVKTPARPDAAGDAHNVVARLLRACRLVWPETTLAACGSEIPCVGHNARSRAPRAAEDWLAPEISIGGEESKRRTFANMKNMDSRGSSVVKTAHDLRNI